MQSSEAKQYSHPQLKPCSGTAPRRYEAGERICGTPYRVLGVLGAGGMGTAVEVRHVELGKHFVMKLLHPELAAREELVLRLKKEQRALGRLDHPHIVGVTDAGTTADGLPYFVMERLEGETIAERLRRERRIEVAETVRIAHDVLDALGAAHAIGLVHRDVKPPNVFLTKADGAKLLDFGVAKFIGDTGINLTRRGVKVGTPRYMSPEQASGGSVDARSDLYAVGLLMWRMVAGYGPFDSIRDIGDLLLAQIHHRPPRLGSIVPGVPAALDDVVEALLAKDPEHRPRNALVVAWTLRELMPQDDVTEVVAYDAPTRVIPAAASSWVHTVRESPGTSVNGPGTTVADSPRARRAPPPLPPDDPAREQANATVRVPAGTRPGTGSPGGAVTAAVRACPGPRRLAAAASSLRRRVLSATWIVALAVGSGFIGGMTPSLVREPSRRPAVLRAVRVTGQANPVLPAAEAAAPPPPHDAGPPSSELSAVKVVRASSAPAATPTRRPRPLAGRTQRQSPAEEGSGPTAARAVFKTLPASGLD